MKNEQLSNVITTNPADEMTSTSGEPGIGTFIDYKRVVLSVTSDLKRLRGFVAELELNESAGLIDEVIERVENDSFTVAVVGEFKRGKSTFINALLGVSVLPTDILPCSATLNRVSYGLTPQVILEFKDDHREDVPFDKLTDEERYAVT
jgi:ribosome biogenesis GTPase A